MLKTFILLATIYSPHGPVVYTLDSNLSGLDCIAGMMEGITPEIDAAVKAHPVMLNGVDLLQGGMPLSQSGAVLSCEFDEGSDR